MHALHLLAGWGRMEAHFPSLARSLTRSESVPFGSRCSQRADEDRGVPGAGGRAAEDSLADMAEQELGEKRAASLPPLSLPHAHIDSLINRQIILTLAKSPRISCPYILPNEGNEAADTECYYSISHQRHIMIGLTHNLNRIFLTFPTAAGIPPPAPPLLPQKAHFSSVPCSRSLAPR